MRLKVSCSKNAASLYVTKTIYENKKQRTVTVEKLGIHKIYKDISDRHDFDYDPNAILAELVYSRILFPSSTLATAELSKNIVQMGLFMDGDGIPLAFSINPENTSEQITLKPLEQKLVDDFGMSKFIVCTDAGLASASSRKFNDSQKAKWYCTRFCRILYELLTHHCTGYFRHFIDRIVVFAKIPCKVLSIKTLQGIFIYSLFRSNMFFFHFQNIIWSKIIFQSIRSFYF